MLELNQFLENATILQTVTFFTFMVTFLGMAAGAFFCAMERGSMPDSYREVMAVSALILAIAAANYFFMQEIYLTSIMTGDETFPTIFRYIDWLLTTPLMLLKFPLMLGMGKKGRAFLTKLIGLDLIMIALGLAGELAGNAGATELHYGFFGIATLAWAAIVYLIFTGLQQLPDWLPDSTRTCVRVMAKFIFFGWMIYPIGYLMPSFNLPPEVRELVYNVGDLINKVGLAMVVYACALTAMKEQAIEDDLD